MLLLHLLGKVRSRKFGRLIRVVDLGNFMNIDNSLCDIGIGS